MKLWEKDNLIQLFRMVEQFKSENKPLMHAFKKFAFLNNREPNSVRNFYYKAIKELEISGIREIDLKKHKPLKAVRFSNQEKEDLLNNIEKLKNRGHSVRNACLKLSGGEVKEMLRLQNKYRSLIAERPDNVVTMPPKKIGLSDNEINSLFMGLVRLVKKCATEEANAKLKNENITANQELRNVMLTLTLKERELENLKVQFEVVKNEKLLLKEEIQNLRSQTADLLSGKQKDEKLMSLKNYMAKINPTESDNSVNNLYENDKK